MATPVASLRAPRTAAMSTQTHTTRRPTPAAPCAMRHTSSLPHKATLGRRTPYSMHTSLMAPSSKSKNAGRTLSLSCEAAIGVIIAGAPASGKGTQCEKIVEKYNLVHISAGDLLRAAVAEGTPEGLKAKEFMDAGELVPNEVVVSMVKARLAQPDAQEIGFLLDGYPRSGDQAQAIIDEGIKADVFILLDVPDEMLVERVVGRRMDPETGKIYHLTYFPPESEEVAARLTQRSDDTEEKCKNRLKVYHSNVDAVIGYYKDVQKTVNGNQSKDLVTADIFAALDGALS